MALRALWLLLPFAVTFSAVVACTETVTTEVDDPSGDDDDSDASSDPPDGSGLGEINIRPSSLYSGFDGTHSFKTPFAVYDFEDDVEVTASPASAVTITAKELASPSGDKGKYFFAEAKAAGEVTLTATSKGRTATVKLTITSYDPSRYAAGEARYQTGNPACTECHAVGNIDHSPSALASVTDEKVGLIVSTGLSASNYKIQIDATKYPNGHKWTTGAGPDQDGLITYMRALEPNGFK